jgi:hypothetical protein
LKIKGKIGNLAEAERLVGREVEGGSLFLHRLMAGKRETVSLRMHNSPAAEDKEKDQDQFFHTVDHPNIHVI